MCTKTYNFYEIPTISRARLRSEEPMEASDILNAIHARLRKNGRIEPFIWTPVPLRSNGHPSVCWWKT